MPDTTDEEVVARALADKEAFGPLIERYEAKLTRYLERLGVGSKEDREDVLQNAFIKAYRNLNSFDPELSFSAWMYRITHNEAMSFFRAKHARPQVHLDESGDMMLSMLRDESADASELANSRLSSAELEKALGDLKSEYRDVLTLRYFEDRSYGDISDILEVPVGTVSTLIHRAKQSLRKSLGDKIHI